MASILRVKLRWSGFAGSPGYSVFHYSDFAAGEPTVADAQAAVDAIDNFAFNVKTYLPPVVKLRTEADVEVIEETTGQLVDVLTAVPDAEVSGIASSSAGWSAAAGAVITWRTLGIRNGRRIRGRTFIVPLSSEAFQNDGTLSVAAQTLFQNLANGMNDDAGTPDLGVWARPSAPGATDGNWVVVSSASVPDKTAILRSRRD